MVGIELRRAGCRWRVTKPALSIASWVLISTVSLPIRREVQALVRIRPDYEWFALSLVPSHALAYVGSESDHHTENGTTKCPESLCPMLALPPSGRREPPPARTLLPGHRSYRLIRRSHSLSSPSA